jgi:hypothetical protein
MNFSPMYEMIYIFDGYIVNKKYIIINDQYVYICSYILLLFFLQYL